MSVSVAHGGTGAASPWRHPPAYIALGGLGIAAPLQLWMLAATLGGGSVASAVPMYQSLLIVLSVAAGGVFFREFESMSSRSVAGFAVGGVIAMAGVAVLSRGKDDDDDDASDVGAELSTPSEEELQTVAAEVAEEEAGDVVGSLDAAAKASRERAASSSRERAISRERALSRGRPRRHSMRDFLGASGSLVVPPAVGVVLPAIREGALQNRRGRVTRRHSFSLSLLPELRAASSGDADDSGSELANLRARTRRAASMCMPKTPFSTASTPPT